MISNQWVLSLRLFAFGVRISQFIHFTCLCQVSCVHQNMKVPVQEVISAHSSVYPWLEALCCLECQMFLFVFLSIVDSAETQFKRGRDGIVKICCISLKRTSVLIRPAEISSQWIAFFEYYASS